MVGETTGPVTVVLGASSGIGAALAGRLRAQGEPVVAMARRPVSAAAGALQARVDVRDRRSVWDAFAGLPAQAKAVVNCVGVGYFAPWDGDYEREWSEMTATNVAGLANVLSVVGAVEPAPLTYLHVGSLAAHRPSSTPGNAVYAATKVAAREMVANFRQWSRQQGRDTRVMALSPTLVCGTDFDTNFFRADEASRRPLFDRPHLETDHVVETIVSLLRLPPDLEVSDLILRHRLQED